MKAASGARAPEPSSRDGQAGQLTEETAKKESRMERKYRLMPIRGGFKKYLITFVCFLAAAAVIIAILSLVTGSRASEWLSDNNGAARESMFPFVFLSSGTLYVMDEKFTVTEIDDHAENAVHDAAFARVYYTRAGDLYEYDIVKNAREKLCSGVGTFYLFKERKSILYTDAGGGLYLYQYNEKDSVQLRAATQNGGADSSQTVCTGDSHFLYFETNTADGSGSVYLTDLSGNSRCLSEGANFLRNAYIWEADKMVSYYEGTSLVVSDIQGNVQFSLENAQPVQQNRVTYAVAPCTLTDQYGDARKIRYVLSNVDEAGSSGDLLYVQVSGSNARAATVDTDIRSMVGYSEESDLALYTKETESGPFVYKTQKGGTPVPVIGYEAGSGLYFDASSLCLYIRRPDLCMLRIDVGDKNAEAVPVALNAGVVYSYPGKPFAVVHSADEAVKSLVLRNGRVESYPAGEERLYGKYDNKYIMCRSVGDGSFSLDYVSGKSMTRISGNAGRNVIFDKNIDYVFYLSEGALYVWQEGKSTLLGEYPAGIEAVPVEASAPD